MVELDGGVEDDVRGDDLQRGEVGNGAMGYDEGLGADQALERSKEFRAAHGSAWPRAAVWEAKNGAVAGRDEKPRLEGIVVLEILLDSGTDGDLSTRAGDDGVDLGEPIFISVRTGGTREEERTSQTSSISTRSPSAFPRDRSHTNGPSSPGYVHSALSRMGGLIREAA